ncbi:hypothetical protein K435DRAFT_844092 [Dendrothele bispora CBS 962.96]|uniref:DUF6534 domain-containing protein n=1 Tax=Dendrothele bispora (strain CBS 962.96) TaxID=1314807 RepID=A0A4S8L443_DENBC|nr:hypothetical protein K435DRAFT_844092 [Dendrothele bispora CBS 962.96]
MSDTNSFPPTVEITFGPLLIGVLFNAILFGVLAVQAHLYFNWNRSDERWTRYLVTILLILETVNTGIDFAMVYKGLFKNFGKLDHGIPFLAAAFYAWRIRISTKSNVLAGFICVLALVSFASSIYGTVFTATHPNWGDHDNGLLISLIIWLTTSAICDVIIAITMIYFLTTHRKNSMGATKSVVNKIIILTIQTGVLTFVAAVADVLTFTLVRQGTMLNAREEWSKMLGAQNDVENISDVSFVHIDGLANYREEKGQRVTHHGPYSQETSMIFNELSDSTLTSPTFMTVDGNQYDSIYNTTQERETRFGETRLRKWIMTAFENLIP